MGWYLEVWFSTPTSIYKCSCAVTVPKLAYNTKSDSPLLTPWATTATTAKAWATAVETLVAWAMVTAADVVASAGWAMAVVMEAMDMAATIHITIEDTGVLASTE